MPAEHADRVTEVLRQTLESRFGGRRSQLAQALGISVAALRKILKGQSRPSYETTLKAATMLGVPFSRLVSGAPINVMAPRHPASDSPTLKSVLENNAGLFSQAAIDFVLAHGTLSELREFDWLDVLTSLTRAFAVFE